MHDLRKSEPVKEGISIRLVENERQLMALDLDTLAQDLIGQPCDRLFPIYAVYYQGRLRAYFHAIQQLVIYPAFHPDLMTPTELIRISRSLITEVKRMAGNPIFMLCDKAKFWNRHTKLVRLKKTQEEAYIFDEEAR
jgi:hypothetical protein